MARLSYRVKGFSVLELLVALTIASAVILMVTHLYGAQIGSVISGQNRADFLDVKTQRLARISASIRRAGLGLSAPILILPEQVAHLSGTNTDPKTLLSRPASTATAASMASDQLTVHYRAPIDLWDCEGRLVLGPRQVRLKDGSLQQIDGQVLIERYFVARDKSTGQMALFCDAARYVPESIAIDGTRHRKDKIASHTTAIIDEQNSGRLSVKRPNTLANTDKDGAVIIDRVDGFWVRVAVHDGDGVRWLDLNEYQRNFTGASVLGVQFAVLSVGSLAQHSLADATHWQVFDKKITINKADYRPRQLHFGEIWLINTEVAYEF